MDVGSVGQAESPKELGAKPGSGTSGLGVVEGEKMLNAADGSLGELGPGMTVNRNHPNIGPRLSFVDAKGKLIARLGGENGPGLEPGKFIAPHGLAVDSRGDIYVGEVSYTEFPRLFPEQKIAWRMRSLQKLQKLA